MKIYTLLLTTLILIHGKVFSQSYPTFGAEKEVTITGLTFDAMEPFISTDGNTLFFNSLNAGGNTNLYYAIRVDDTTFNYVGLVGGTYNPSPDHLDAVASIDLLSNFFWVSTRNYPTQMENLHRGIYTGGNVSNISRVYGDFNIYSFNYPYGWLIMDASIDYQGDYIYYCNALFEFTNTVCGFLPCEAKLGIAQKVNDSTFNKIPNTDAILNNVNDTNYLVYAPQVTKDGLELYYTRLLKGTFNTEICVSIRTNIADTFSLPMIIHSNNGLFPEAPTITTDKQKLYYHMRDNANIYKIFLKYRYLPTNIEEQEKTNRIISYPNPSSNLVYIEVPNHSNYELTVYNIFGEKIFTAINIEAIDVSNYSRGIYMLTVKYENKFITTKIIKN